MKKIKRSEKKTAPREGAPAPRRSVAATTARGIIVAAAAAAKDEDQDDDPAAIVSAKSVAHIVYLLSSFQHHTMAMKIKRSQKNKKI